MKRNLITLFGVVIVIAGIVGVRTAFQQTIKTEAELAEAEGQFKLALGLVDNQPRVERVLFNLPAKK